MKTCLAPVTWMAVGAAALLLPLTAAAQVPFSSTQSPGLGPFNRSSAAAAPLPARAPVANNQPPQGTYNGNLSGSIPLAPAVTGPVDPDHKLGPRDQVSYRVAEDRDNEDHPLTVTDSGEVMLPLGGLRVRATGKTTQQLAADIKGTLEREYYKPGHATVTLGLLYTAPNASKGKVFITGEVMGRGAVDLPADGKLTLYKAILQQGGFTPESDLKGVFLYREGAPSKGIQVNCKAISNGETDKDIVLQPGDTIKVKKRFFDWQY